VTSRAADWYQQAERDLDLVVVLTECSDPPLRHLSAEVRWVA